jgi:hypothetical protein
MKDLGVQMTAMSEQIDKLTEENRALRTQKPVPATQPLLPPLSTPPRPKRKRNGASNPAPAGEAAEGYLAHINSHALGACGRGDRSLAAPAINICHRHGPALREDETQDGWEKVERKHEGKGKEKCGAGNGKEVSVSSWAGNARGRGVCVTVVIGGSRDASRKRHTNPKKKGKKLCESSAVGGGTGM